MRLPVLLLLLCASASAQIEKTLASLYSVKTFREAAISPDGKRIAWTENLRAKDNSESSNSAISVMEIGGTAKRVSAGEGAKACSEHGLAWSPDSRQFAFLSNCANSKQAQVYVATAPGGTPRKLTNLTGFFQNLQWSPDGRQLAVLYTENAVRVAGATEPTTPDAGVVEEKFFEQRLTLLHPINGTARQISPADTYVYEYDWAPNGNELAYTAAKGAGDNNWWIAELYAINAQSGAVRHILKPPAQIAAPRWSPDGKTIAFVGGLMSDEGSTGGDVYTVSAAGGAAKDLTPGRKTSPAWLRWTGDSTLLITEREDGGSAITTLNTETGAAETLWRADESLHAGSGDLSLSLAKDGKTAAVVRTSWSRAPEVWTGPIGDWKQVTHANASATASWGEAKKLHWQSEGTAVQGWLLYPKNYDPKARYPMVVSVHGGPAAAKSPAWPSPGFDFSAFSAEGYFVLFPNPRGSYGQGEKFTTANVKDFGNGDLKDILAGVDEVVRTLPVDGKRVGIGGWSYGGYMTMWAVTQTNRFKAAVAGAGIANWQSYYGENSIDEWMIPYFGASVYDDPAVYAKSSPITYIKNVRTPTLVVVGDRDGECPAPQSYEFWHAIKAQGVKTKFIVYPNEGHRFHDPKHVEDLARQTVAWFNENLK
ncbi:MAG: S9 family peptidase [Acidobacteriota bacterium]|nr:S9 family peptidase [Acidobacteriota bacterium]